MTVNVTPEQILALIPQQKPFRFVDEIMEVDEKHVIGKYTFRKDELFYRGHFPDNPITPGVILIETMAQIISASYFMHLLLRGHSMENVRRLMPFFTNAKANFFRAVPPDQTVVVKGEQLRWKMKRFWYKSEMRLEDGTLVAKAVMSGG